MGYLIKSDYRTFIQGEYLVQLIQGDDSKRVAQESQSIQEIAQRVTQRYDLDAEFTETLPYSDQKVYKAGERVVIDVSENGFKIWESGGNYVPGMLAINAGIGYRCKTANTDATFTASKWTKIAAQYTIFHVAFPACTLGGNPNPATIMDPYAPVFNYKNFYAKGDIAFWRNHTYVCNQPTTYPSHQRALQAGSARQLQATNVFPDSPLNSTGAYWKDKTPYVLPTRIFSMPEYDSTSNYIRGAHVYYRDLLYKAKVDTDTPAGDFNPEQWEQVNYFIEGDNRNQTIKDAMVRISVFKLAPLLSPKNIPDLWLDEYRRVLRDLNDAAQGKLTLLLPLKQPRTGTKTWWTSEVKRVNNY